MYSSSFEIAVDHAMLYEVGRHWDVTRPGVLEGLIETKEQRRAVGYVVDPLDRGGETKFGIARNANPDIDVTNLDWEGAKAIYFHRYWITGGCEWMPGRVAILHFDGCVNHGVRTAVRFLQRAIGTLDDGIIGKMTLQAISNSDPMLVCESICNQREQFYRNIVARDPTQSRFLRGWLTRINDMRELVLDPEKNFIEIDE